MSNPYPRVVSLKYHIEPGKGHAYGPGVKLSTKLKDFSAELAQREAIFTPLIHFASADEAIAVLQPQLDSWEIHAMLTRGVGSLIFRFVDAYIQEQPPTPGLCVQLHGVTAKIFGGTVAPLITHSHFVEPPTSFAVDANVEDLAAIYEGLIRYPRNLLHFAYAMTSRVSMAHGTEKAAANALGVDHDVIRQLNSMSAKLGVGAEARKHDRDSLGRAPTQAEREWIEKLLRELLVRAGAIAAGSAPGGQITLQNSGAPPW